VGGHRQMTDDIRSIHCAATVLGGQLLAEFDRDRPASLDALQGKESGDAGPGLSSLIRRLLVLAVDGLASMQVGPGAFAFTRRCEVRDGVPTTRLEGVSHRYTAIVALGARHLPTHLQRGMLGGLTAAETAEAVVDRIGRTPGLGDAAMAFWAAAETGAKNLEQAAGLVDEALSRETTPAVVDLAWTVSGAVSARELVDTEHRLRDARRKLLSARGPHGIFGHTVDGGTSRWRAHVGCFADQVYPIQALARLHAADPDAEALAAAQGAADRIVALQGDAGQWWWHYDRRTGGVVEGYPVYSVHQHAMGPMALLALAQAGGRVDADAIARGMHWLEHPPETGESMIRPDWAMTWRKVARREPGKAVRAVRAGLTAARPGLRARPLDPLFPPGTVDRECRPYELGWLLDTWLPGMVSPT
jgi:hypothetical protein